MDFFEVIRRRRSVRHFTGEAVKETDLRCMFEAALLAPSATNEQPWHFIVVRNDQLIRQMQNMVNAMIESRLGTLVNKRQRAKIERYRFYSNYFGDAPVVIAILARPWPAKPPPDYQRPRYDPSLQSVAAAIAQLHLAATALGYASCWATGPVEYAAPELEAMLEVRDPWYLVALLTVGIAARSPKSRPHRSLDEITTFIG